MRCSHSPTLSHPNSRASQKSTTSGRLINSSTKADQPAQSWANVSQFPLIRM